MTEPDIEIEDGEVTYCEVYDFAPELCFHNLCAAAPICEFEVCELEKDVEK